MTTSSQNRSNKEPQMTTQDIRRAFTRYFQSQEHRVVPSSPVVPHEDPTLLFTNAGMNQFKDLFLGKSTRDTNRAVTIQKCIRAGGKHNDLENVGHTRRHLTFFEMLGNFSFGDYFKADAIRFAWEVSTEVFGFAPEQIWPTVFRDDDEAFTLWEKYVPVKRITRLGEKDNFWSMGETGPCGPCSELLYDRGSQYGSARNPAEDPTGERFLEFWNLVFMQYNRSSDGIMQPLPRPSIDTGAGLERVMSLKANVETLFETDVLRGLIAEIEQRTGRVYQGFHHPLAPAFHVLADHVRTLSFAIADGAQPSNVDRGYVLRKILRRAVRYGRTLGIDQPFLAQLLPRLVSLMGEDYPELARSQHKINEVLSLEEEAFLRTLRRGGNLLSQIVEQSKQHQSHMSGDDAFRLKDTYGLPLEEVQLLAKDAGLDIDMPRYLALEEEAKERSRKAHKKVHQQAGQNLFEELAKSHDKVEFTGYQTLNDQGTVRALFVDDHFVPMLEAGQKGMVFLDKTPFYAEQGGQIGDKGLLQHASCQFEVSDTQAPYPGLIAHVGLVLQGELHVGDVLTAQVDAQRRQKIANNHTATHLLHFALHEVLGAHIKQAGSVVDDLRLRFDFHHHKPLTAEEIRQVEDLVNSKIRANGAISTYELPCEQVQKETAIKQFFGEKYGAVVRVVDIDHYSKELCGGTHTKSSGTIGLMRIAKESSIAAGVRRIEAVTGEEADAIAKENDKLLHHLAAQLKTQPTLLSDKIEKLLEENRQLQAQITGFRAAQRSSLIEQHMQQAIQVGEGRLLMCMLNIPLSELRHAAEEGLSKLGTGLFVCGAQEADRLQVVLAVSPEWVKKGINAGDLAKEIAPLFEGSGGGKPQFAQVGGKVGEKAPPTQEAFSKIESSVRAKLEVVKA